MKCFWKQAFCLVVLSLGVSATPVEDLQAQYERIRDGLHWRSVALSDALLDQDWKAVEAARAAIAIDEARLEAVRVELSGYTFLPACELQPYDATKDAQSVMRYDWISDRPYYFQKQR